MIRCVVYNLSGGLDPGALATVLRSIEPDIVCATEVPSRLALRRLAGRSGLGVAVRAGRRRSSVAILVSDDVRVISADSHDLTAAPDLPQRSVAQAIVGVGTTRLAVFSVQFGTRPDVRLEHARELEAIAARVEAPVVVGADLNEAPSGAAASRLSEVLVDAWAVAGQGNGQTFPNPEPMMRSDYLFVDRRLAIGRATVVADERTSVASHHLPLVVDLADVAESDIPRAVPDERDLLEGPAATDESAA